MRMGATLGPGTAGSTSCCSVNCTLYANPRLLTVTNDNREGDFGDFTEALLWRTLQPLHKLVGRAGVQCAGRGSRPRCGPGEGARLVGAPLHAP